MKKNLLLLALLTTVSFGFTACGGDKEDEISKPTNVEQTEQKYKDDAVKLEFNDANPIDYYVEDEQSVRTYYTVKELELTESGYYFVKLEKKRNQEVKATRASGPEYQIIWGMYTKREDGSYDLAGFGYITLSMSGNSSAKLILNLVTGTEDPNTTIVATVTVTPPHNNGQESSLLCRAWDIVSTRVQIEGVSGFYQEQGCNINSILDYIKNYSDVKDNLMPNTVIETIVFSDNGTFALLYKNPRIDIAAWRWVDKKAGTLSYDWDFGDMGYSFIDGTASVTFGDPTQLKLFGTVDDGKGARKKVTATINIK